MITGIIIKNSLGNNLTFIKYDNFKKAIYMKLQNYSVEDSLKVVKLLEEKGVNNYVVRH
ncbi:MAG: hypothetical protein RMJ38_05845 [candidate division WOR-3 bacterium]|nr:hypothetical protein [candidate division WOR-3 bacterium]MDW8150945.1 hypothetical protein [candidate division WOR-3 bacterium]